MAEELIRDIVCNVYAGRKSKEVIFSVLNEFIPNYETINLDYTFKPDDKDYVFKSEDEIVRYFIDTPNLHQTFYWNQRDDNPDNIAVGANITDDDQLIISLTLDGNHKTEAKYYLKLKKFLDSEVGVISYINPAEYEDGKDFVSKYKDIKYDFE